MDILWTLVFVFCIIQTLLDKVSGQCSGSPLTVSSTEVPAKLETPGYSAGGYTNNLYCEWLIDSGVTGQRILFYSHERSLSANDVINIYDGSSTTDTSLVSNLGGSGSTVEYTSSGRYVLVTFTSDSSTTNKGFELTHVSAADTSGSGCSSEYVLTASTSPQYLTSQGFPATYASSSSCRWRISASNSVSTVNVELVFIDIENDVNCAYDKLTIYDGSYICENKVLSVQCPIRTDTDAIPDNFTSTADSVLILLTSDSSFEKHGFVIKYTENFVATTTTTTPGSTTSPVTSATSGNSGQSVTSEKTETETEVNIPLMAASAVSGAAFVLGILAGFWLVKYVKSRKKQKKGVMTVQSIAPLPARPVFAPRHQQTNVLSFV